MTSLHPSNHQHVPAWKRVGLKLKNASTANGDSALATPVTIAAEPLSKKRKAAGLANSSPPLNNHGPLTASSTKSGNPSADTQPNERPLKRKKSVTFVDGTKKEDVDANEKLLEDYVAQQQGGDGQFSKAEIASFTAPTKVHPANEPSATTNGSLRSGADKLKKKGKKQKERTQHSEDDSHPQPDPPYVSYLKEYQSSRATWKFNKIHQRKLLDNIFNLYRIPIELDDALSSYLAGLQGDTARKRLIDSANEIVTQTSDLSSIGSNENMTSSRALDDAKDKALKVRLKQTKSTARNQAAADHAYSDEHQEKLKTRKRAELILKSLAAYPSPTSSKSPDEPIVNTETSDDLERPAKKMKKTRRSRKVTDMRTGLPDDDDTDETSSVSSVPSSVVTSSSEEDSSGSDGDDDEDSGPDDERGSETASSEDSSSEDGSGTSESESDT